jgi:hypothetical protein
MAIWQANLSRLDFGCRTPAAPFSIIDNTRPEQLVENLCAATRPRLTRSGV